MDALQRPGSLETGGVSSSVCTPRAPQSQYTAVLRGGGYPCVSEVFMMVVCLCCQTAISLLTWGHEMNSALSRNSLKVLGYICCKQWEMPLAWLRMRALFSFSGGHRSPEPGSGVGQEWPCAVEREPEGSVLQMGWGWG